MASTAIRRMSYDEETRTLFVTFIDGDLYAYRGVEPEIHRAFVKAASQGGFFARRIRNRYTTVKMPADALLRIEGER